MALDHNVEGIELDVNENNEHLILIDLADKGRHANNFTRR